MLTHYVVLSLKVLRRRPFFTFISLFGISFTLVVLMVVTAVIDHSLAPGPPETRQHLMLGVRNALMQGPNGRSNSSAGFRLYEYAENLPGVTHLTAFTRGSAAVYYLHGEREERTFKFTAGDYWDIFDFDFLEGAPYTADDVAKAQPVAVINRSTRTRFFGDQPAVGRYLENADLRLRVVGVVEDVAMLRHEPYSDIWAPHTLQASDSYRRELLGSWWIIALARDAAAMPGIREAFNARLTRVEFDDPRLYDELVAPLETFVEYAARASPFGDRTSPDSQAWRFVAFLTVVALMFIALPTVNLININVSRIMERSSEIGVRKAFGAPARTLVGQFVVENILLTLCGGAIGLVLSALVLGAINDSGFFPYTRLAVNGRVFAWGVLLAVAFGLISGVYPAWRMARLQPVNALRGGASR